VITLLGISGSIRKDSFHTKLLHEAARLLPEGVSLDVLPLADIPLYNHDLNTEVKPEPVQRLLDAIARCDGLLVASPEYNYSVSGVLKNAIDWASRPAYQSVLARKPAAIISGASSIVGGARGQMHLRDVFSSTLTLVAPSRPFFIPMIQDKFDEDGALVHEDTIVVLTQYLEDFVRWIQKLS